MKPYVLFPVLLLLLLLQVNGSIAQTPSGKDPNETVRQESEQKSEPEVSYKNNSLLLAGIISNLGEPFRLVPPTFAGGTVGIEMLLGKRLYFGSGLNLSLLGASIPDQASPGEESRQWLYFIKAPVFGGFRVLSRKASLKVEFGLAYNFEPQTITPDWDMEGFIPKQGSVSALMRLKGGFRVLEIEFGLENGITELFSNHEDFHHRIMYIGTRINF